MRRNTEETGNHKRPQTAKTGDREVRMEHKNKTCRIMAVANQNGGVGKTTTAYNLGHGLAKRGEKVLLVDFDPQGNLSLAFGIEDPESTEPSMNDLLNALLEEEELPGRDAYVHAHRDTALRFDIIPSNINLSTGETNLRNAVDGNTTLRELLEPLRDSYDSIIIDTNPYLGILTINALTACDEVIIPVSPQLWSAAGLQELIKTIGRIKRKLNPGLSVNGILLTICDERTNLCRAATEFITENFGERIKIYGTRIPNSTKVGEANYRSESVSEQHPNCKAATAYDRFTEEILARGGTA